jgi:hypothetical protein
MILTGRIILRGLGKITEGDTALLLAGIEVWSTFLRTTYVRVDAVVSLETLLNSGVSLSSEVRGKVSEALDLAWDPELHGIGTNPALPLFT